MNKRIHLKFEHPLATPGASWVSRIILAASHACLAAHALQMFMGNLTYYILITLTLFIIELIRKNPDAKPYVKELFLRICLHIFLLGTFIGTTYALNFKIDQTVVNAFHMSMFLLMFLNLYEAVETFRGRISIRVLNKNK